MNIIKTHDVTLYGGNDIDVVLRPLSDEHLPLLYKWCADPEVLYWTEGGTNDTTLSYGAEYKARLTLRDVSCLTKTMNGCGESGVWKWCYETSGLFNNLNNPNYIFRYTYTTLSSATITASLSAFNINPNKSACVSRFSFVQN